MTASAFRRISEQPPAHEGALLQELSRETRRAARANAILALALVLVPCRAGFAQVAGSACNAVNKVYSPYYMGHPDGSTYICDGSTLQTLTTATASPLRLGIGTPTPATLLDISGTVKVADGGESCSATVKGGIRYTSANVLQYCNSTAWQTLGSGGGSTWNGITDPTGNLSLTMGANTSLFTYNAATGSSDLFKLIDTTGDTGTGYLMNVTTASGSHANPLHLSAQGTADLVFTSAGRLGVGTASPQSLFHLGSDGSSQYSGALSLGTGTFGPSGTFSGNTSGTEIAVNAANGYGGDLLNLEVNGSSKFKVDVNGDTVIPVFTSFGTANGYFTFPAWGAIVANVGVNAFAVNGGPLAFGSGLYSNAALWSDGNGLLAQYNGTGAQDFRIYNTRANSTNFERAELSWQSNLNVFTVQTTAGSGGGAVRNIALMGGNVGIGTPSPSELLDVNGRVHLAQTTAPGTTTDKLYNVGGTLYWNGTALGGGGSQTPWTSNINAAGYTLSGNSTSGGNLKLDSTSNATKGYVLLNPTGGNVGIGTTTPAQILSLYNGSGNVYMGFTSNSTTFGSTIGLNGVSLQIMNSDPGFGSPIYFYNNASMALSLTSGNVTAPGTLTVQGAGNSSIAGNVGIGTTAPGSILDIQRAVAGTEILLTESSDSGVSPALFATRRSRGTNLSSPTAIQSGNYLGGLSIQGYGTSYAEGARIYGVANQTWTGSANGTDLYFATVPDTSTTLTTQMVILNSGNVGIGTQTPGTKLEVNGQVTIDSWATASATTVCRNGNVLSTCSSSIRYKENVKDLGIGLPELMSMRPVSFKWKDRDENDFGFIAEEMHDINPLFNTYEKGRIEGVKYPQLTAVIVNAVKTQQKSIESLKAENASLKAELEQTKLTLRDIEGRLKSLSPSTGTAQQ